MLNTAHPNAYILINAFKKLETEYAVKIMSREDGTFVLTRRAVDIAKDQSIETVKEEFRRQLTTLPEFFKKMCQIVGKASYTMNLDQEPVTSKLITQDPVASQLFTQDPVIA